MTSPVCVYYDDTSPLMAAERGLGQPFFDLDTALFPLSDLLIFLPVFIAQGLRAFKTRNVTICALTRFAGVLPVHFSELAEEPRRVAFVLPVGTGKTTYAQRFGGWDIDLFNPPDFEARIARVMDGATTWPEFNKYLWTYQRSGLPASGCIFLHSYEQAEFFGIDPAYIFTAKLPLSVAKSIKDPEHRRIAIMNWRSTPGRVWTRVAIDQLVSDHTVWNLPTRWVSVADMDTYLRTEESLALTVSDVAELLRDHVPTYSYRATMRFNAMEVINFFPGLFVGLRRQILWTVDDQRTSFRVTAGAVPRLVRDLLKRQTVYSPYADMVRLFTPIAARTLDARLTGKSESRRAAISEAIINDSLGMGVFEHGPNAISVMGDEGDDDNVADFMYMGAEYYLSGHLLNYLAMSSLGRGTIRRYTHVLMRNLETASPMPWEPEHRAHVKRWHAPLEYVVTCSVYQDWLDQFNITASADVADALKHFKRDVLEFMTVQSSEHGVEEMMLTEPIILALYNGKFEERDDVRERSSDLPILFTSWRYRQVK